MRILFLMLMGVLAAQDLPQTQGKSRQPEPIQRFELSYWDIREHIHGLYPQGRIEVAFEVTESGHVENPIIVDTFNVSLNDVVIDKIKQTHYLPALQNGIPVRVRYKLPILFK